jgi:uncharacterized protein
MLRVRIAPLSDGLHTDTLTPTPESLDLDPAEFSDVSVEMTLDVSPRRIVASFAVSATAHLICDRTDVPFDQTVRGTHSVLIVSADNPLAVAEGDDVVAADADATHADLTVPVRDTLVLAVPIRRVCPEAEALDLQMQFGAPAEDEPRDDRWAALSALRGTGDSSESAN